MKNNMASIWAFWLATTAAWIAAVTGGMWLLDSTLIRALPGGFAALAVVGLLEVLVISIVQRLVMVKGSVTLWLLGNAAGFAAGTAGIVFANLIANMPVLSGTSGNPRVDWLLWLGFLFVLSAVVSAPGGLVAGLLQKWAVGGGSILTWAAISVLNWGLSFGAAAVLVRLPRFMQFFYAGNFRYPATLLRGAAFGALVGLIQGGILGSFLREISQTGAASRASDAATGWKRILPALLVLGTIGCVLGYGLKELGSPEQDPSWASLGTPPSPAVRFVRVSPLIVAAENGEMYRFISKDAGWERTGDQPAQDLDHPLPDRCENVSVPALEDTLDTAESCARYEVGTTYRKFAIREDGSVWMWKEDIDT